MESVVMDALTICNVVLAGALRLGAVVGRINHIALIMRERTLMGARHATTSWATFASLVVKLARNVANGQVVVELAQTVALTIRNVVLASALRLGAVVGTINHHALIMGERSLMGARRATTSWATFASLVVK